MSETTPKPETPEHTLRLAGRIAHIFIQSKLTPLVIIGALLLGVFSILQTPREEEPQIVVPMLDVFVQMPGASAAGSDATRHRADGKAAARTCRASNTSTRSAIPA